MDLLFHRSVVAPSGFPKLVSFDIGPSGQALTTWATAEGKAALNRRITAGPHAPPDIAVAEHWALEDRVTILPRITTPFINTQCLLDGFLIVGARCRWTPEHIDKNALRFDRSGQLVQEATLGDGISCIATTAEGLTWAGYFDEGIFGNLGWGGPGPEPIGQYGINCFNADLQLIAHAPGFEIAECYAMNAVGESVYACCYTDWNIRRLDPSGKETTWTNRVSGAHNLVVSGNIAALIGSYKRRDRAVVGNLEDGGGFRISATGSVTLGGGRLPPSARLVTRGHELHALINRRWYRCELTSPRPSTLNARERRTNKPNRSAAA